MGFVNVQVIVVMFLQVWHSIVTCMFVIFFQSMLVIFLQSPRPEWAWPGHHQE